VQYLASQEATLREFMTRESTRQQLRDQLFPYEPELAAVRTADSVCFAADRSSLFPSMLGAILVQPIPTASRTADADAAADDDDVVRVPYPGFLVTEAVYEELHRYMHVPTGCEVPCLKYKCLRTSAIIKVIVVGLPTQAGPCSNCSSRGLPSTLKTPSALAVQAAFAVKAISTLAAPDMHTGLITVPSDFLHLSIQRAELVE
jgi:hypothetical protein